MHIVTVNLGCRLGEIWSHLRDTLLELAEGISREIELKKEDPL